MPGKATDGEAVVCACVQPARKAFRLGLLLTELWPPPLNRNVHVCSCPADMLAYPSGVHIKGSAVVLEYKDKLLDMATVLATRETQHPLQPTAGLPSGRIPMVSCNAATVS